MPQFHIYSTASSEVIAGRIITSTEKEFDVGKVDYEKFSVERLDGQEIRT